MSNYSIPPGIRSGESPSFYKLDSRTFEELCRDIFDAEQEITTCGLYGDPGQSQDGIDLIATRKDNKNGIEVGQCKCYENFQPRKIREVSDTFFEHWNHWQRKNIKRFVLFVASDLNTRQRREEILYQRKRFDKYGIEYEVWDAAKIRNKLRAHPGIVATYLRPSEVWVKEICGHNLREWSSIGHQLDSPTIVTTFSQAQQQLEQLLSEFSRETQESLDVMRRAWREGKKTKVLKWIDDLRKSPSRWDVLLPQVKAQVLRFEAGLSLEGKDNVIAAKKTANIAYALDPSDQNQARIKALIAMYEFGAERAIDYLQEIEDIDGLNLLAALYLEINDKVKCRDTLTKIENTLKPNAETHRLKALLKLAGKDIKKAEEEILKALEIAPNWVIVRYTAAIIDYFNVLSPGVLPDRLVLWPEPVDWVMVKKDADSLQSLENAEKAFRELLDEEEKNLPTELLEAWYVACLIVNPDKQQDALQQIQTILLENPANYYAITWVIARNLEINLEPSTQALGELLASNNATIAHIIALVGILIKQEQYAEVEQVLSMRKQEFIEGDAESLWIFWMAQVLALSGQEDEAQRVIDSYQSGSVEIRHARSLLLEVQANRTKDREKLIKYLEEQYEETKNPIYILQSCDIEFRRQNWEFVNKYGHLLVEAFKTAEILRLVILSAYNTQKYSECLDLIDNNTEWFGQKLPAEIRRLRASCLQAQGKLKDAITELESASQDVTSFDALKQRAQMYYEMGDLKKISLVSRQLMAMPEITSQDALGLARMVMQDDAVLAQSLWGKAISLDLPDELVGYAYSMGFNLGLEKRLGDLHQRFYEVAQKGTGGIAQFSQEEFKEFFSESVEKNINVSVLYEEGNIPVHLLAERQNITLAELIFSRFSDIHQDWIVQGQPLFIRHGGKVVDKLLFEQDQQWRLHIDITAILLADSLGILEHVQSLFAPLHIPLETIPTLIEMSGNVSPHQPSQIDIAKQISELVNRGILKLVNLAPTSIDTHVHNVSDPLEVERRAFACFMQGRDGYILDFLSHLNTWGKHSPDIEFDLVSARNIADALLEYGKLSELEHRKIVLDLGIEGVVQERTLLPEPGASIYCFANIISTLSGAGLLGLACKQFDLYTPKSYYERVVGQNIYYEKRKSLSERIDKLREKLRDGLEKRKYEIIPSPLSLGELEDKQLYGLHAIFSFPREENDLIWVDDRYLNGFSNRDGIPIIAISEILSLLLKNNKISKEKYFSSLHKMRTLNLRYLPLEVDEVVYFLKQAEVREEEIAETKELLILKQYFAKAFLDGHLLQKPPLPEGCSNPLGELSFVFQFSSIVGDVIEEIWSLPDFDTEIKQIYCDWIVENLFISPLGLSETVGNETNLDAEINLAALSLATLVIRSITIKGEPEKSTIALRKHYLSWLDRKLLNNHFDTNPAILETTASVLKKMLLGVKDEKTDLDESTINILLQQYCSIFPISIFDEFKKDDAFMSAIGMDTVIAIGDLSVNSADFWHAAYEVANGRKAKIPAIGLANELVFSLSDIGPDSAEIVVEHPENGERILLQDSGLGLLSDSLNRQIDYLHQHKWWFDLSSDAFDKATDAIVSIMNPQARVEKALKWKHESLNLYYSQLFNKLRDERQFNANDLLPPSIKGMLRFYRLNDFRKATSLSEIWKKAATELLAFEGVEYALEHLWGMPIPLSAQILVNLEKQATTKARGIVKKILKSTKSPISMMHQVRVLVYLGKDNPAYLRLAQQKIKHMLSEEFENEVRAFLSVLRWVHSQFSNMLELQRYPVGLQLLLAWAHSHHLYSIFTATGAPVDWLHNTFYKGGQLENRMFEHNEEYEDSILNPRHANPKTIIASGISYCIGDTPNVLDIQLQEVVRSYMLIKTADDEFLHLYWLGNLANAQNLFNSFLASDTSTQLKEVIAKDAPNIFDQKQWIRLSLKIIDNLSQNTSTASSWGELYVVLGILPLESVVENKLSKVIQTIEFSNLVAQDLLVGIQAIHIASVYAPLIDSPEYSRYLREQLIEIAKLLKEKFPSKTFNSMNDEEKKQVANIAGILLETVRNISKSFDILDERVQEFEGLSQEISYIWPIFARLIKPIIQLLCEILPPSQAKYMWKLLLFLRSLN